MLKYRRFDLRRAKPTARPTLEQLEGRDVPAPLAPTGVAATGASASSIHLTWTASPDASATGYDVYETIWVRGVHSPRGSGGTPGHYVYALRAGNLHTTADTIGGLGTGTYHTYVVTSVGSSGQSIYSAPATGETWVAPTLPYGPSTVLLSSGALWSSPVAATAGLTTQFSLLANGNPLTFSVVSGPSTLSIDPHSGVATYTPAAREVGTTSATFKVSNALGSVTQTVQLSVAADNTRLPKPTLSLYASSSVYNGQYQPVSAKAVGTDGVTLIGGSFAIAYNGGKSAAPLNAGTYPVLVTFTSADPHYGNATLLTTYTVTKTTPAFNYLSSPTITAGDATTTVSGYLSAGLAVPAGDFVVVTINGVSQGAVVSPNSTFSATFATIALPVGHYTVSYAFGGDANFTAANASTTLTVNPTAPPQITTNPRSHTVTAGDVASFTVAFTGSPTPTVQWQVSTDGGTTWTNITGNTSARTATLSFFTSGGESGYKYRAVVTNRVGSATSLVATLTVEGDTGGGDGGNDN